MLLPGSLGPRPELFQHPHILLQPDPLEDRQRENEKETRECGRDMVTGCKQGKRSSTNKQMNETNNTKGDIEQYKETDW